MGLQYKVKDMTQADFGRLEIELAEAEMPGLIACRTEFGAQQPFKGAKIAGSLHMTIQTAVLIETLTALGAGRAVVLLQHLQHSGVARRQLPKTPLRSRRLATPWLSQGGRAIAADMGVGFDISRPPRQGGI